jgi:hypothetical protein
MGIWMAHTKCDYVKAVVFPERRMDLEMTHTIGLVGDGRLNRKKIHRVREFGSVEIENASSWN